MSDTQVTETVDIAGRGCRADRVSPRPPEARCCACHPASAAHLQGHLHVHLHDRRSSLPHVGDVTRCVSCAQQAVHRGIECAPLCSLPGPWVLPSSVIARSPPWPQRNASWATPRRRSTRAAPPARRSCVSSSARSCDACARRRASPARPRATPSGRRTPRSAASSSGASSFKERDIADLLDLYGVTDPAEREAFLRARPAGQHPRLVAPLLRRAARLVRDVRAARAGRVDDPQLPGAVRARPVPDRGVRPRRHRRRRRRRARATRPTGGSTCG